MSVPEQSIYSRPGGEASLRNKDISLQSGWQCINASADRQPCEAE